MTGYITCFTVGHPSPSYLLALLLADHRHVWGPAACSAQTSITLMWCKYCMYYMQCLNCIGYTPGFLTVYLSNSAGVSLLSRGSTNKKEEICLPVGCRRWECFSQSWTLSAEYYTHIRNTTPNMTVLLAGESKGLAEHRSASAETMQVAWRKMQ